MVHLLFLLLLARGAGGTSVADRVEGELAVERARYRFVIGATQPFDAAYPRAVFEKKVAREIVEESVLRRFFSVAITPRILDAELDRIEKGTKAPDQWKAIKTALGNDRRRIEEVFCRPLLVERMLYAKFAFDPAIHAGPHQRAREARAELLAGRKPVGVSLIVLSRGTRPVATEDILAQAQKDAALPRVLERPRKTDNSAPVSVEPEMAAILERELKKPGDVTTILEERERFSVFRLIERTPDAWKVEGVTFPKVEFDSWFEKTRAALPAGSPGSKRRRSEPPRQTKVTPNDGRGLQCRFTGQYGPQLYELRAKLADIETRIESGSH